MTLETGVKELAEAVGADVKALANGKVNSNDPRLTDAREWSAATVTQAEAEAGTASTRRAWTAQRVRQAIAAWFGTVSKVFGRKLLLTETAAAAHTELGLGTAATRDVGISKDNVMAVGAGGWLANSLDNDAYTSDYPSNESQVPTSTYRNTAPFRGIAGYSPIFHVQKGTGWGRLIWERGSGRYFVESGISDGNGFTAELLTSGNIQTSTGQSTQYPMTQKATTDALNTKANTSALGTAAARDVGTDMGAGNVMQVGAFGLGDRVIAMAGTDDPDSPTQFYVAPSNHLGILGVHWGLHIRHANNGYATQMEWRGNNFKFRTAEDGVWSVPYVVYHTGNIQATTGQSTIYPMTQKAVTDAINARGFADASGILTVTSGALSNDMSSFLSQTTKATMRSNLEVPQLNASATAQGGLKARLSGTTLYLSNNGTNP